MNARILTVALLATLAMGACKRDPAPVTAPPSGGGTTASTADEPETFLGRKVKQAIDEARTKLRNENLSLNGNMRFGRGVFVVTDGEGNDSGGNENGGNDSRPRGEITPQGDLLIDGRQVEITPEQRQMLLQYREEVLGVAEAGMALGIAGAELGGKALGGVAGAIFGGKDAGQEFEARMKAEGERLAAEGRRICTHLRPMLQTQQQLAEALPAFKPYATMTQSDIDNCLKDADDANPVATAGAAAGIDDAERQRIRESIREGLRRELQQEAAAQGAPATQ